MSKVGIPQPFPEPLGMSHRLSFGKSSARKVPSVSIPDGQDFFKTFSYNSNSSYKPAPSNKKKCPKGTRKNRQTKVCETISQILLRTKRRYTKGANKKCPKGTRRNKLNGMCDPK